MEKARYYKVTTTQVIQARNKADAIDKARRRPKVEANVLETFVEGERIPATEAKSMVA